MELRITGESLIVLHRLTDRIYIIGRSEKSDICIPDPWISGVHCQLTRNESGEYILTDGDLSRDRPSTHGTFYNGKKLEFEEGVLIRHRDIVKIGKSQLEFWKSGEATKAATDETIS